MDRFRGSWIGSASGLMLLSMGVAAVGQTFERNTTITGPRGRTLSRSVTSERGPGFVQRDVTINRPAGTFSRETTIQRPPIGFGGGRGFGPIGFGGGNVFVERNVIVPSAPIIAPFGGGMFFGSMFAPPLIAPPVVVAAPPIVVGGAVAGGAVAGGAGPAPVVVGNDPVISEMHTLEHSLISNHRRDAAIALGRYRDPRAVDALIERLKNDHSKDVRMAAAWGLAEIGDKRAGVALERASMFDKKQEVRDAAAVAYKRIPSESLVADKNTGAQPARTASRAGSRPVTRVMRGQSPGNGSASSNSGRQSNPFDHGEPESVPPPPEPAFPSGDASATPPAPPVPPSAPSPFAPGTPSNNDRP